MVQLKYTMAQLAIAITQQIQSTIQAATLIEQLPSALFILPVFHTYKHVNSNCILYLLRKKSTWYTVIKSTVYHNGNQ